ncbi:Protein of uncharacterised function (DUF1602) [Mycobacteroides abscessus]|nr:Protein of uncharacterised function (DUF1602) [Mycobacteroides abscessus]
MTSSAVVGSSATRSFGSHARACAIIARWRCPPESWCGYASNRRSGSGISTSRRSSIARFFASAGPTLKCVRMVSTIWKPTV